MERSKEWPEEAVGLWLVRTFVQLPPEKRTAVLKFIEEISGEQDRRGEASEAAPG